MAVSEGLKKTSPSLAHMIFGDGTPQKALATALVVGSILTLINHGDQVSAGSFPPIWKVLLTYMTPYCVTTWGAVTGKRAQWKLDFAPGSNGQSEKMRGNHES